jgi:hypothetical protein
MISNIICFLCGKTGCGKSYTLNYILHREYKLKRREGIVVLDLRDDHLNLLKLPDFYFLKITPLIFNYYDLDWAGILQKYPYLLISPYKISREEYEKLTDDIAKGIVDIGNRIFVLEEAGLAFPVYSGIRRNLSVLITTGRKLGIDFYFTSQRPSFVSTVAVSQANIRIAFTMDDANDINRVKTYFENVDIANLKRFEFVARNEFTHEQVISNTSNLKVLDKILWQSL